MVTEPEEIKKYYVPNETECAILNYLKSNPLRMPPEVARAVDKTPSLVARYMKNLTVHGFLSQHYGTGRGIRYKFITEDPLEAKPRDLIYTNQKIQKIESEKKKPTGKTSGPPVGSIDSVNNVVHKISTADLHSLAQPWSQTRWQPKIVKSARNLPIGLARLFELANEAAFGSKIEQSDLNGVRLIINDFRQDIVNTLNVVDAILNQNKVWDPKEFITFMMESGSDPEFYRTLAQRIRENN